MKTPEMAGKEIGSVGAAPALSAMSSRCKPRTMRIGSNDLIIEMKYVDAAAQAQAARAQAQRPMQLGPAHPLRLSAEDEAFIKTLCAETPLAKATILRMSCHAGLLAIDWSKFKHPALSPSGVESKPAAPKPAQSPVTSLRILRHGVAEHVFSDPEFIDLINTLGTLHCFWALEHGSRG